MATVYISKDCPVEIEDISQTSHSNPQPTSVRLVHFVELRSRQEEKRKTRNVPREKLGL